MSRPTFSSALVLLLLCACDSGTTPVDAATSDAPMVDAASPPMSRLLGSCVADGQCPGNGAFCRTAQQGYPLGMCTVPCTDRTACDDGAIYNTCATLRGETMMTCIPYCRNAADCRPGYTCQVTSAQGAPQMEGYCIPVCASDAECGGTSQCDPYTGRCVAQGMVGTTGALTGEMCNSNADCRSGQCRLSEENGNYTGYVHGYCESLCRIPSGYNTSNFFSGDTLPQGSCAGNAVCIPGGNEEGVNDLGVCLASCMSASDCRPGYTCSQNPSGNHTFSNGFCVPMDCMRQGACPTGFTCHAAQDAQGNAYGICG